MGGEPAQERLMCSSDNMNPNNPLRITVNSITTEQAKFELAGVSKWFQQELTWGPKESKTDRHSNHLTNSPSAVYCSSRLDNLKNGKLEILT